MKIKNDYAKSRITVDGIPGYFKIMRGTGTFLRVNHYVNGQFEVVGSVNEGDFNGGKNYHKLDQIEGLILNYCRKFNEK